MNCPGCTLAMTAETYDGNYGGSVEIDVCHHCNGFWFDGKESMKLSPRATLMLFKSMAAEQQGTRAALVKQKRCPHCSAGLRQTQDMQGLTRFTYFVCDEHGRYTTFFHFLREKGLLRQPTPKQLAELKRRVQQLQCSNCGAPIDLTKREACEHCEAPVSVLSTETLEKTVKQLEGRAAKKAIDPAALAAELKMQREAVRQQFRVEDMMDGLNGRVGADIVLTGLRLFLGM